MFEFKHWKLESPQDVDTFERDSRLLHGFQDRVYFLGDNHTHPGVSREDFLQHLRELTQQENPGSWTVCCSQEYQGTVPTLFECWVIPSPDEQPR